MTDRICSQPDCERPVWARGMCTMHYNRTRKSDPSFVPWGALPTVEERFWPNVDKAGDCWLWTGLLNHHGYGQVSVNARKQYAHRVAYELTHGLIPEGLTVDHLCHNADLTCPAGDACQHRRCVNPDHLEAVTQAVNVARGHRPWRQRARTHCTHGHEFTPENTGHDASQGYRYCLICDRKNGREAMQRRRDRLKEEAVGNQ